MVFSLTNRDLKASFWREVEHIKVLQATGGYWPRRNANITFLHASTFRDAAERWFYRRFITYLRLINALNEQKRDLSCPFQLEARLGSHLLQSWRRNGINSSWNHWTTSTINAQNGANQSFVHASVSIHQIHQTIPADSSFWLVNLSINSWFWLD